MTRPRTPRILINPEDNRQIAQMLSEVLRALDGGISFGHPQDPQDDTSTNRAGDTSVNENHNGTLENINGSWVEIVLNTTITPGTAITCNHNLNLAVPVSGEPNVRWLLFGTEHSGTGTPANTGIAVYFQEGDTVGTDSIQLRVGTAGLTVNDANPLKICLFFIPAVRFLT